MSRVNKPGWSNEQGKYATNDPRGWPASGARLAMGRPWAMDFTESDSAPRVELPKPPGFSESSSHDTV